METEKSALHKELLEKKNNSVQCTLAINIIYVRNVRGKREHYRANAFSQFERLYSVSVFVCVCVCVCSCARLQRTNEGGMVDAVACRCALDGGQATSLHRASSAAQLK